MSGELDIRDRIHAYLDRVDKRDDCIHAFASFDRQIIFEETEAIAGAGHDGPLAGQPIAVKDVIDAKGWPTLCNSPICGSDKADRDAEVVASLRAAGAIIFGKAVTTEFAFTEPGPTVNPHDPTRTPGGSSSGSAAAVADHQCFAALTTQTGGSTIRPASFCGIFGYKPPFGRVPNDGLRLLAQSFDTIGVHARSVSDLAAVAAVMEGRSSPTDGYDDPAFVVLEFPDLSDAEPYVMEMVDEAADRLAKAGAKVRRLRVSEFYSDISAAHRVVMSSEMARTFAGDMKKHPQKLSDSIRGFIELGQGQSNHAIAHARAVLANRRADLLAMMHDGEIILQSATTSEATKGLASTGSASFNRVWTAIHTASLTLPFGAGPSGLPLGLQLIDPDPRGNFIFPAAQWAANALDSHAVPVEDSRMENHGTA